GSVTTSSSTGNTTSGTSTTTSWITTVTAADLAGESTTTAASSGGDYRRRGAADLARVGRSTAEGNTTGSAIGAITASAATGTAAPSTAVKGVRRHRVSRGSGRVRTPTTTAAVAAWDHADAALGDLAGSAPVTALASTADKPVRIRTTD